MWPGTKARLKEKANMIKTVLISTEHWRMEADMVWIMAPLSLDSSSKRITNCAEVPDLLYTGFNNRDTEEKRSRGSTKATI